MWSDLDHWRTFFLGLAGLGSTLFVLLYLTFYEWWTKYLGRALFFKALILSVFLDSATVSRIMGWSGVNWFWITLYALFALAVWWQFIAFLRVKIESIRSGDRTGERQ